MTTRLITSNKDISNDIELNTSYLNKNIRIGIDTTLWDILKGDNNIVFFSRLCGFTYEYDKQKSILVNVFYRIWFILLICLTVVGFVGYIYNLIFIFYPQYTCYGSSETPITISFSIFAQLFLVTILDPLAQVLSIVYSFYSIKKLLDQQADKDSLYTYQLSLGGSKWFYISMTLNVVVIWFIIIWHSKGAPCELGAPSMMIFFDLSSTSYTSFVTFILSANINRITSSQEKLLIHAKERTLTHEIYINEKHKVNELNKDIFWSSQILIVVAILNVLSWLICYLNFGLVLKNPTLLYEISELYSDSGFFLKEFIFSIYIAWQSVKINTLSNELSKVLGKSTWLTNENLEKDHLRLSLYVCVHHDPISFKILGKIITKGDIVAYMISIIIALFGKIIQKAFDQ